MRAKLSRDANPQSVEERDGEGCGGHSFEGVAISSSMNYGQNNQIGVGI
jgi:hypothetical protein